MKRVMRGDIESFAHIVRRYQKFIFSLGMRLFKNSDDSHDFTQEVFIKSYEKITTFRGIAPFRFWLAKLAYNFGISALKSAKSETAVIDESLEGREKSPESIVLKNELREILKSEINRLPENYRVCLDLYFYSGFTFSEISSITELPMNTIKSNVFRAKNILRNKLKGTMAEKYYEM